MVRAHQVVGGSLRCSVGTIGRVPIRLRESRIVGPKGSVHLVGRDVQKTETLAVRARERFMEASGLFCLLEEARSFHESLSRTDRERFRFLHVSTDEVYGSLGPDDPAFTETNRHAPNSPYAASKAAADHLVRSYHHTYGLPTLTTNCSNNYGPYQFPEKLIPLMIRNALAGKPLPVYGDGKNVRDWLFVLDHCEAVRLVLERGRVGETYNIGGNSEKFNNEVVKTICDLLEEALPRKKGKYSDLVTFVKDRLGHDRRYAIDATKIKRELGWAPRESFASGIRKTVRWYIDNQAWSDAVARRAA